MEIARNHLLPISLQIHSLKVSKLKTSTLRRLSSTTLKTQRMTSKKTRRCTLEEGSHLTTISRTLKTCLWLIRFQLRTNQIHKSLNQEMSLINHSFNRKCNRCKFLLNNPDLVQPRHATLRCMSDQESRRFAHRKQHSSRTNKKKSRNSTIKTRHQCKESLRMLICLGISRLKTKMCSSKIMTSEKE